MAGKISLECGKLGKINNKQAFEAIMAEAWRRPLPGGRPYTENVNPDRSHLNRYWTNGKWSSGGTVPDFEKAIDQLMAEKAPPDRKKKAFRSDAVKVRSIIYQVSPEFCFPKVRDWPQDMIDLSTYEERGPLDMAAVDAWHNVMENRLKEFWGDRLLAMELHLDENCPHIHCQLVPVTDDGRLSSRDLFTPAAIKAHLDEAAAWCKDLGLVRARKGGTPGHVQRDPQQWAAVRERERARQVAEITAKEAAMAPVAAPAPWEMKPTPLPPKPKPPKEPKKPDVKDGYLWGLVGRDDSWEADQARRQYEEDLRSYEARMEIYEDDLAEWRKAKAQQQDPAWKLAEAERQMAERLAHEERQRQILLEEVATQRERADKAEAEARKASKAARQAEARALREIPLAEVLTRIYSDRDPHQDEGKMWLVKLTEAEAATAGHTWRRIGVTGLKFIDNRDHGFAGRGAIDLVMAMDGHRDYKRAAAKLASYFPIEDVARDMATVEPDKLAKVLEEALPPPEPEPAAPAPDPRKDADLQKYLVRQLAIQPDIARHLAESAQVYMDDRRNLVIPRPAGGAFVRGTVALRSGEPNRYKRTTGSRHAGAAILTGPKVRPDGHVILAEGPRSALALLAEYPHTTVCVVGGSLHADLPDLKGRQVWLAFDNDDGGNQHRAFYKAMFPEAKTLTPPTPGQDWLDRHLELVAERQAKAQAEAAAIRKAEINSPSQ